MLFMRTTWRVTCLGLMVLGPLLTACGGDDDNATDEASATSTSAAAPSTGVYGEPTDPDAGEPTQVATDTPAAPTSTAAPSSAPSSSTARVAPRLTYFGWNADIGAVEAGGLVPSIVESGGRCTLTLTQGGSTAGATSEAVDNVTSTSCSEMVVPGDRLSPGTWQAVLSYESDTAAGASEPVDIEVP
jgi:hypothetical protein